MSRRAFDPVSQRAQVVSLAIGYACIVGLLVNMSEHLGWLRLPFGFLHGAGARWTLTFAAGLCFVIAWYFDRLHAKRGR